LPIFARGDGMVKIPEVQNRKRFSLRFQPSCEQSFNKTPGGDTALNNLLLGSYRLAIKGKILRKLCHSFQHYTVHSLAVKRCYRDRH